MIVFDLDDTLYAERDFVRSGYLQVAKRLTVDHALELSDRMIDWFEDGNPDVFQTVLAETGAATPIDELIQTYREHRPAIRLAPTTAAAISRLIQDGHTIGLMTDGRSVTQRNKIAALGLDAVIDEVLISEEFGSEKPDERNYRHFERRFQGSRFAYVGDNLAKDFITANRLGWTTVGLRDSGRNIHPQHPDLSSEDRCPQFWVSSLGAEQTPLGG